MPNAPGSRETDLQRAILEALKARGWWAQRMNAGTQTIPATAGHARRVIRAAPRGTPDILVLAPYGWLEVKTASGELLASQALWHRMAMARGVRVATVRSIGEALQAVQSWVEQDRDRGAYRCISKCPLEDCHA